MIEMPLFPLRTVLFPGGVLPLKVFEARYMDLATRCLKVDGVFGICLIAEGAEVGAPARPHALGTTARIIDCDMRTPGVLDVVVRGEQRFRLLDSAVGDNSLLVGRVELLDAPPSEPVPADLEALVPLLRAIVADLGEARMPLPHRFDDADWLGMRYAEVLPIPAIARQRLLELDDPVSRLEIIRSYLAERGLIPD